jgi:hypothetical protein
VNGGAEADAQQSTWRRHRVEDAFVMVGSTLCRAGAASVFFGRPMASRLPGCSGPGVIRSHPHCCASTALATASGSNPGSPIPDSSGTVTDPSPMKLSRRAGDQGSLTPLLDLHRLPPWPDVFHGRCSTAIDVRRGSVHPGRTPRAFDGTPACPPYGGQWGGPYLLVSASRRKLNRSTSA